MIFRERALDLGELNFDDSMRTKEIFIGAGEQLTFAAFGITDEEIVFELVLVVAPNVDKCGCVPAVPTGPAISATQKLIKNGKEVKIDKGNIYVIIDAPQGFYIRAILKNAPAEDSLTWPRLFYKNKGRVDNNTDTLRGIQ